MKITPYEIAAFFITIAVAIAYVNHRYIKMQPTIAVMFASLLISLGLILIGPMGLYGIETKMQLLLNEINFYDLLMKGMLSFLLFAGALTVDLKDVLEQKWEIGILAVFGTIASTLLVALGTYFLLPLLGIQLPFIICVLFGALISPTDPIAVLAMCKEMQAPRKLSASIAGESLFNDGVGIVIFITVYEVAFGHTAPTFNSITLLFLREAIGGIGYGVLLGLLAFWLMKPIRDHKMQVLITLAITTGGYSLAQFFEVSGPLSMVIAGIFLGNSGRWFAMNRVVEKPLFEFWELVDEILNTLLFLLIGFEILLIAHDWSHLWIGLSAIPIVLLVRCVVVAPPLHIFKRWKTYSPHMIKIMIWGGLRGGLAVALALALPNDSHGYRDSILAMTYAVVVFSILIQGSTIKTLVKKTL